MEWWDGFRTGERLGSWSDGVLGLCAFEFPRLCVKRAECLRQSFQLAELELCAPQTLHAPTTLDRRYGCDRRKNRFPEAGVTMTVLFVPSSVAERAFLSRMICIHHLQRPRREAQSKSLRRN
jgi:hypothetical protein